MILNYVRIDAHYHLSLANLSHRVSFSVYSIVSMYRRQTRSQTTRNDKQTPQRITKSKPKDPDYLEDVTIVKNIKDAKRVVAQLQQLTNVYHACDTETTEIDLENQSPVGNGSVICASIFCGPEYDFGTGSRIWIGLNFIQFVSMRVY